MKKNFYTLLMIFCAFSLTAQERYVDEVFSGITVTPDVEYGRNISILTQAPVEIGLIMDIYEPAGDTATDRPVILIAHTGSFLPAVVNGTSTGTRQDSTTVECARRLVRRGYVVGVYDYRLGWNPVSPEEDIRKGTLLQAAYRGIQDTRTAARYFRRTVAEEGNPYGINPDNIGVWGIGTGGYLALGAGSIDEFSEVTLAKFRDENGNPLINEAVLGDIYATSNGALCISNHEGYSSDIDISFNMGGAMGDSSWIDGNENESTFSGVHCTQDLFAPYFLGTVIVPTTQEEVVEVTGTRGAIEIANNKGNNDVFNGLSPEDDPLSDEIEFQKSNVVFAQLASADPVQIPQGTDNFYGFNIPIRTVNGRPVPEGSPWDWWSLSDLENLVAFTNATFGRTDTAINIHESGLLTNPDMSAEKARRYIDTVFMLAVPRLYMAMELGDAITATEDLVPASQIGLNVFPNPAQNYATVQTDEEIIRSINIFNSRGLLIERVPAVNATQFTWDAATRSPGLYLLHVRTDNGTAVQKVMLQ